MVWPGSAGAAGLGMGNERIDLEEAAALSWGKRYNN